MRCPSCGGEFAASGRRRYCSEACRQAGHRRRHRLVATAIELPPTQPRRPVTVYACPDCDQRFVGEQRCPDCNAFCRRIGIGGCCPNCDEPVTVDELVQP